MGAVSLFITSCTPPEVKPVPPLNPAAAKVERPAPPDIVRTGKVSRMPLGSLYQLVQGNSVLVYDVRPSFVFALGHIPGAINWPKKSFEKDLSKNEPAIRTAYARNIPVVVYCTDLACPDGLAVATALSDRGHSVSVLQGGYEAWKTATE